MLKKNKEIFIVIFLFVIVISFVIFFMTYRVNSINNGKLIINEVMANNTYTLVDNENKYSDWIELYNGYDYDINLKGYYLSDNNYYYKWSFPDVVIKSNSYLIVYASGNNYCKDNICHTNFKLDNSGEIITLTNNSNKVLSRISYSNTESDTSYGIKDNNYVYYYKATPSSVNIGEYSNTEIIREKSLITLKINEYMNNNTGIIFDEDNSNSNAIELYNYGETDINLKGYYLSDRETKLNKYTFPDIVIKSNSYLIVYLSGKDKCKDICHTNFKLTNTDTVLILSDSNGSLIDKIYLVDLPENTSSGLYDGKYVFYTSNSLGKENSSSYYTDVLSINNLEKELLITEVSSIYKEAIEIKNITSNNLNLSNYMIGDKSGLKVKLPNVILKPNSYYVVYGSDYSYYNYGNFYTGFRLNNSDEIIYLYKDNYIIDSFVSGKMTSSTSYGLNNSRERRVFNNITLGNDNSNAYLGYSSIVNYSINGGYVENGTKLELNVNEGDIYYTLDGSNPSVNSIKYTEPITINKTTVVKSISIKENYLVSEIASRTFFVDKKHDIAIVSLSTNSSNLFGYGGIYTSYRLDSEREITFEFYESDGTLGTVFNGGVKLVGQDSREFPQKSMAIYLRKQYGLQEVVYPFFDEGVNTFSSFTLRNSGEDVANLKIKDAFLIETIKGQMDVDYQNYRPVAVYINGSYWGLYNIREKINESYLANNHNVDEDNIDLVKGINDVRSGTIDNYNALVNYIWSHNTINDDVYAYLETQIDMQELVNYWIFQTYYNNTDTGNIRFWRTRDNTGKWRWVLFDLDWCMFPSTYRQIRFNYITKPYGHGYGGYFPTTITYNLWKNAKFRDLYLTTFAYHLKNTFYPERVNKILDEVSSTVRNEMNYQIDRWYQEFKNNGSSMVSSISSWDYKLNEMKNMVTNRYSLVINNLKSQFNLSNSEYEKYFGDL